MVYAIIGKVTFPSNAQRDALNTWLLGQIGPETMHTAETATADTTRSPHEITFTHRYTDEAARDRIWLTLDGQIRGRGGVGWMAKHQCNHDQSVPTPCVETVRTVF